MCPGLPKDLLPKEGLLQKDHFIIINPNFDISWLAWLTYSVEPTSMIHESTVLKLLEALITAATERSESMLLLF